MYTAWLKNIKDLKFPSKLLLLLLHLHSQRSRCMFNLKTEVQNVTTTTTPSSLPGPVTTSLRAQQLLLR
jgi:hypothetical protein